MAQTLDEFMKEERERLVAFEAHWRACHAVAPNAYPLSMDDGNEGLWFESLSTYGLGDQPPAPGELEPVPEGYVPPSPAPAPSRRKGP